MKGLRRVAVGIAALMFVLSLTGCRVLTGDTESLLRPPLADEEQKAIVSALEMWLTAEGETLHYVLKYPKAGAAMSAFLMEDVDGDDTKEAVCFYCLDGVDEKTHVNLLRKTAGEWRSVGDAVGQGTEVEWVAFGDLQGDGTRELLTGWNVYSNSRDRQLVVYSLEGDTLTERYTATYSAIAVGDMTGAGRDELLLLSVDSAQCKTTASLMALEGGTVNQLGQTLLDGSIQQFGEIYVCALTDTVTGVFVDAYKDNDQVITELVCFENGQLSAPFYDKETNQTERTAREASRRSHIVSTDVSGDGVPEWPRTRRLTGYADTTLKDTLFLTTWMQWDHNEKTTRSLFDCIVNDIDGYYLRLDPAWVGGTVADDTVSARYTTSTHTFELVEVKNGAFGKMLLSLTPASADTGEEFEGTELFGLELTDGSTYAVRYTTDPSYAFTEERIRYLLTTLN